MSVAPIYKQNVACDQYPGPGALAVKIPWIGDHFGPQNYQAGGYNLTSFALGLPGGLEWVNFTAGSNSGNYLISGVYPGGAGQNEFRGVTYPYITMQSLVSSWLVSPVAMTILSGCSSEYSLILASLRMLQKKISSKAMVS